MWPKTPPSLSPSKADTLAILKAVTTMNPRTRQDSCPERLTATDWMP